MILFGDNMNFRNGVLILLVAMFLLSGCIKQEYYQKVNPDGTSTIRQVTDFSGMVESMDESMAEMGGAPGENFTAGLLESCSGITDDSIACSVDGYVLTLEKTFTPEDGYYTFEVEQGLYNKYRLTVNKVPSDVFADAMQDEDLMGGAEASTDTIDLTDKTNAKQTAQTVALISGMELTYNVEMPGAVKTAYVDGGDYTPEIEGNTAEYDLLEVFDDSGALVVESEELNILWVGVGLAVIIIAILAVLYFKKK